MRQKKKLWYYENYVCARTISFLFLFQQFQLRIANWNWLNQKKKRNEKPNQMMGEIRLDYVNGNFGFSCASINFYKLPIRWRLRNNTQPNECFEWQKKVEIKIEGKRFNELFFLSRKKLKYVCCETSEPMKSHVFGTDGRPKSKGLLFLAFLFFVNLFLDRNIRQFELGCLYFPLFFLLYNYCFQMNERKK